jgi:hypothetical protein
MEVRIRIAGLVLRHITKQARRNSLSTGITDETKCGWRKPTARTDLYYGAGAPAALFYWRQAQLATMSPPTIRPPGIATIAGGDVFDGGTSEPAQKVS